MKMLVISDTHGNLKRSCEVFEKLKDVDLLVHLGDHEKDAEDLGRMLGVDYVSVKGNMDGAMRSEDSRYILDTEYGKIYLTHGHTEGVSGGSYDRLLYRCEELGCKAVFFGHTHVPCNEEIDGIRILNPGSISRPRDGSDGSYAVVHTYEDRIDCSVIYYRTDGGPPRKKPGGGFLRNMLNNSDRF